jgi:hypothetical protein
MFALIESQEPTREIQDLEAVQTVLRNLQAKVTGWDALQNNYPDSIILHQTEKLIVVKNPVLFNQKLLDLTLGNNLGEYRENIKAQDPELADHLQEAPILINSRLEAEASQFMITIVYRKTSPLFMDSFSGTFNFKDSKKSAFAYTRGLIGSSRVLKSKISNDISLGTLLILDSEFPSPFLNNPQLT